MFNTVQDRFHVVYRHGDFGPSITFQSQLPPSRTVSAAVCNVILLTLIKLHSLMGYYILWHFTELLSSNQSYEVLWSTHSAHKTLPSPPSRPGGLWTCGTAGGPAGKLLLLATFYEDSYVNPNTLWLCIYPPLDGSSGGKNQFIWYPF